ncbi:MAG: excinuclease ABC subunit UvrB [Armatimonadetes bacterium]|nr:excinuclease ABC subunit UvrB [Candidatus Hippobium faecium]
MNNFKLVSDYKPSGSQPQAIKSISDGVLKGNKYQTILGVTGSGKTYTMASVIEKVQRPTLVIAHNKTLAAQLCSEFREFFPHNHVEYFVSYYDYYLPEFYIPESDLYIEKDSSVNDEIDRLRHSATQAVLEYRDTVVVASVSCIYGIGSKESYTGNTLYFEVGRYIDIDRVIESLVQMKFSRNNLVLDRGLFRVKGDILEIQPIDSENIIRISFFGDEIENINIINSVDGKIIEKRESIHIYPATHFVTEFDLLDECLSEIEEEMEAREAYFKDKKLYLEAQRIRQRTEADMEMIRELGYCSGIENYSRIMDRRKPGERPNCLIDYFPKDFLLFIDESHQTIPQLRAMYAGDRSRKENLVDYGFRLPSALDNRPLKFNETEELINQVVWVSATPGPYEKEKSENVAELIIRPTGLLDPETEVRPTEGQIDDLIGEITERCKVGERVLVTTLTKRMAEDLTEYLKDLSIKVAYIHSDVKTLERGEILRDLRLGVYDVLVGINLLREGLDLPEVSLVAILDADKEGFLRSETSLIQTIGRAARHERGKVIMYGDKITGSMDYAIKETNRRREIQEKYNREHGIIPKTVVKSVRADINAFGITQKKSKQKTENINIADLPGYIEKLEKEMKKAAKELEFEQAAMLRDKIHELKKLERNT